MNCTKRSAQILAIAVTLICLFGKPVPARAQFGGGTQIVFDSQMFARQLRQLQQETATVTNLAQQLQYAIKNTTGGSAGVWQSNQNLLTNLGNLINEQEGLSYTFQGLTQEFQQLYPGFNAASTGGGSESAGDDRYNPKHSQRGARFGAGSGAELPGRAGVAANP